MANKIWTSWNTHLLNLSEMQQVTTKEYARLFGLNLSAVQIAFLKLRRMKLVDFEKRLFYTKKESMNHVPHYYYVYCLSDKGWQTVEYFKNRNNNKMGSS